MAVRTFVPIGGASPAALTGSSQFKAKAQATATPQKLRPSGSPAPNGSTRRRLSEMSPFAGHSMPSAVSPDVRPRRPDGSMTDRRSVGSLLVPRNEGPPTARTPGLLQRSVSTPFASHSPERSRPNTRPRAADGDTSVTSSRPRVLDGEDNIASTCASSLAGESAPADLSSSSSRVLFAKASELIRVEVSTAERRISARLDQERKSISAQLEANIESVRGEIASLLSVVEALSAKTELQSQTSSHVPSIVDPLSARVPPFSARADDHKLESDMISLRGKMERVQSEVKSLRANDVTIAELLVRVERLSADVQARPTMEMIEQDRRGRALEVANMHQELAAMSDEMHGMPAGTGGDESSWNKFNTLLEHERLSRDSTCRQLRKDIDTLTATVQSTMSKTDEEFVGLMMDQQKAKVELATAAMKHDIFQKIEAVASDVKAIQSQDKTRLQGLEQQASTVYASCANLQDDMRALAFQVHSSPQSVGRNGDNIAHSQPRGSPLEARLESTAHLAFAADADSKPIAFQSVFAAPKNLHFSP